MVGNENEVAAAVSRVVESADVPRYYPGITTRWLDKARCTGEGPRFIKVGKKVLYRLADIEAWLDEQTRQSTSDTGPPRKRVAREHTRPRHVAVRPDDTAEEHERETGSDTSPPKRTVRDRETTEAAG